MQSLKESETCTSKMSLFHPSLPGSDPYSKEDVENYKKHKWWTMPRNQCFPDMTRLMHIRTQSNYSIIHRTCTGSSTGNPNSGKGEVAGTSFYFLAKNSSPLIVSGRGKNQFPLKDNIGISAANQGRLRAQE